MSWQKTASGLLLPGSAVKRAVVPIRSGKVARLWKVAIWTKDGMIHWEDEETGKYDKLMPARARERFASIVQHIGTSSNPGLELDRQEREKLKRQFAIIAELLKEATEKWEEQKRKIRMNIR